MKRQRQAHSPHTIGRVQDTTQSVILRNFGITDTTELETLEAFFLNSVKYGSDSLKSGLANMFEGMQNASELHSQMTTEIHTLYEGIVAMKRDILEAKEQGLAAETIAIQATEAKCNIISANYDTAILEIGRMESLLQDGDNKIIQYQKEQETMHSKLQEINGHLSLSTATILDLEAKHKSAQSKHTITEQRLAASNAELVTSQAKLTHITSQPGAPFYDPNTNTAMVCPVLQGNGLIVPLKSVISKWFETAGYDDGYTFRTYICPLMQHPTTLASLATQDRIRHIAKHAGMSIESPLVFSYMSDAGWSEFPFHDQLNIIAKMCTIQTMQIDDCVEQIMVNRNTMALEIQSSFTQDGRIRVKCTAEKLGTHSKYAVRAVLTSSYDGWNPLGSIQFE